MPIYTDGLIVRRDRNLLDDVVTGQGDAAEAAFDQAWFENPLSAVQRIQEFGEASQGAQLRAGATQMGRTREALRAEPTSPLLSAEDARARVKDSGLDLTIEDSGIREAALDILMERKRAENERQFILQNAPASTVPVQLLAGFAASAADPINLASAFIPVVGEARYASMLARAGSRAARFGVRARVGALEGATGAALLEPLTLYASAQDQSDYDISDSMLNLAFGSVLGGGLHGAGGLVSDMRRARLRDELAAEPVAPIERPVAESPSVAEAPPSTRSPLADAIVRAEDDPVAALRASLQRGLEADRGRLVESAGRQAADELAPTIRAELEEIAAGRAPDVRGLRAESAGLQRELDALEGSFKVRAKDFQRQRMSRKQAERAARDAIKVERQRIEQRQSEIAGSLDSNRQAEGAKAELAMLRRGETPERFKPRIDARAKQIADGFELRDTARLRAEMAPWYVRENALRTAVAQAVSGRPVDVESVFDMADPLRRPEALERIKRPAEPVIEREAQQASQAADASLKADDATDLASVEKLLADEQALTDEIAAQAGIDLKPFTRAADEFVADAEVYAAAYRAAAICQLRF